MCEKSRPAGTIDAEKLDKVVEGINAAFSALILTAKQAARALGKFAGAVMEQYELHKALQLAKICTPRLVHFYQHTKKRRIRKKYAKRILAWYREEVAQHG